MTEVFAEVQAARQAARQRAERDRLEREITQRRADDEARDAQESEWRERAFAQAFPTPEQQHEAIVQFCAGMRFRPDSIAGRLLAIGRWWNELADEERKRLTE
jgi:hypothetical protein